MPSFCSFLILRPGQTHFVERAFSQAGLKVRFVQDPYKRFRFFAHGHSQYILHDGLELPPLENGQSFGDLLLYEGEEIEAQNITHLIKSAANVLNGFPNDKELTSFIIDLPADVNERKSQLGSIFSLPTFGNKFYHLENCLTAIAIATKAWSDPKMIYAILKLSKSIETDSVTPWSTHPRYKQKFAKHSDVFLDHIGTSLAINLAFSAIEELGLKINSTRDSPRWLDGNVGKWNPKVLADIKDRLTKSGIDPDCFINWVIRGDQTEAKTQLPNAQMAGHSDNQSVRDLQLCVPDALHTCSHLRNYMTAHAFGADSKLLGPYEVFNVQNVARFLILHKLKMWNISYDELMN